MSIKEYSPNLWSIAKYVDLTGVIQRNTIKIYNKKDCIYNSDIKYAQSLEFINENEFVVGDASGKLKCVNLKNKESNCVFSHLSDNRAFRLNNNSFLFVEKYNRKLCLIAYDLQSNKKQRISILEGANVAKILQSDTEIGIFTFENNEVWFTLINKSNLSYVTNNITYWVDSKIPVDLISVTYNFDKKIFSALDHSLIINNAMQIVFFNENGIIDYLLITELNNLLADAFWFAKGEQFAVVGIGKTIIFDKELKKTEQINKQFLRVSYQYNHNYFILNSVYDTIIYTMGDDSLFL